MFIRWFLFTLPIIECRKRRWACSNRLLFLAFCFLPKYILKGVRLPGIFLLCETCLLKSSPFGRSVFTSQHGVAIHHDTRHSEMCNELVYCNQMRETHQLYRILHRVRRMHSRTVSCPKCLRRATPFVNEHQSFDCQFRCSPYPHG